jgi:SOS-response transcriptional repressor LexA
MHTFTLPLAPAMEPFFKASQHAITRTNTGKERRGYHLSTPTTLLMQPLMESFDVTSETRVVEKAVELAAKRLPVLAEIHCGGFEAIQSSQIERWVALGDLLPYKEGDYLLRAHGESTTGGDIAPNDLVLMRPQNTCDSNDIAAVMLTVGSMKRPALRRVRFALNSTQVELISLRDEADIIVVDTSTEELEVCAVKRGVVKGG